MVIAIVLLFFYNMTFAQVPALGSVTGCVLFSSQGNIKNTGSSNFSGDIGTNNGLFTGFGNVNGVMHKQDSVTAGCAADLDKAYNYINSLTASLSTPAVIGNGDTLGPGVYSIKGNGSLRNSLTLDAKGNANAIFIFNFQGTFSSTAGAKVNLVNGATPCNIFWKTEGVIALGAGTIMKGTLIAHNASINIAAGVFLDGRALSTAGDISVNGTTATVPAGCGSSLPAGPIAPVLASATGFALFSGDGTVINKGGGTIVKGDVGTNVSFTDGYDSTKVTGAIHAIPDGSTATSAIDVRNLYNYLYSLSADIELLYPALFGNKLVLTPHTYVLNTATFLSDTLYLNAGGNSDAVFVVKVNGAFSVNTNAKVVLTNGAQSTNVFWMVDGAVTINNRSDFTGTIVSTGAVSLNGPVVNGRAFTINGALNTASAVVTAPGCCNETNSVSTYTWVGGNGDWNVASNWSTKSLKPVPTGCNADVIIASGSPSVTTGISVRNVQLTSSINLSATGSLGVCGSFTGGSDTTAIINGPGKVILIGTAAQSIKGKSTFTNLELNNAMGAAIDKGSTVNITGSYIPSSGSLITNGGLVLKSSADGTASIATGNGDYMIGDVTVERYIPSKRAYRFLTAPINAPGSIKENWMENANNENTTVNRNPSPGYGTHITGSGGAANGFDVSATNNPSLFTFNNQTQGWVPVTNTGGRFNAGNAYRIMIRGSRSTNLNNNEAPPSVTTLRATGSIVTGPIVLAKPGAGGTTGMPELTAALNAYSFIANPYPSVVDWKKLKKKDISKSIYYYDPSLTGSSGRGAYVTYNDLLDVVNVPGSKVDNYIQSGQAFFVQTIGADPSLTFSEDSKATTQKVIFRQATTMPKITVKLQLPSQETTGVAADGFAAYFSNEFDSSIADEDSYKLTNLDENIGILRNGKMLSIEGRKLVVEADTLPIRMWQMSQNSYTLKINVSDFDNVFPYLEDSYLNSRLRLNNNAETSIQFSLNADPLSSAPNRFKIVFKALATLPIHITKVNAFEKEKHVVIQWEVQNETGVQRYVVEKSADMRLFEEVSSSFANNKGSETYSSTDIAPFEGDSFYRIKIIEKTGAVSYTEVVKARLAKETKAAFSIYPNPVKDRKVTVQMVDLPRGQYRLTMYDQQGRPVFANEITCSGNSSSRSLVLPPAIASGSYYFILQGEDNLLSLQQNALVL